MALKLLKFKVRFKAIVLKLKLLLTEIMLIQQDKSAPCLIVDRYEDTVGDIEKQSRRILDFLDLDFQEQVLEFHKTKRIVKTPSASQVRQPIYKDSVAAWKNYEKHLQPLIDNLTVDP